MVFKNQNYCKTQPAYLSLNASLFILAGLNGVFFFFFFAFYNKSYLPL